MCIVSACKAVYAGSIPTPAFIEINHLHKDHGLAAELWTLSALVRQVRTCAIDAGFPLAEVGKTTVWRILNEQSIKPHRVRYYLEKRDPEFDRKKGKCSWSIRRFLCMRRAQRTTAMEGGTPRRAG